MISNNIMQSLQQIRRKLHNNDNESMEIEGLGLHEINNILYKLLSNYGSPPQQIEVCGVSL